MTKQKRVSISVRGRTYDRVKAHCESTGKSVSGFLEDLIAERLPKPSIGPAPVSLVEERPRPVRVTESAVETEPDPQIQSQHRSW